MEKQNNKIIEIEKEEMLMGTTTNESFWKNPIIINEEEIKI